MNLFGPARASAQPQIPSRSCLLPSSNRPRAQNDNRNAFEDPVQLFEVSWRP